MADAPKAPKVAEVAKAPKALKTFEWKDIGKDSVKITFLKGERCDKLPTKLVASYRKAGLIEPAVKED